MTMNIDDFLNKYQEPSVFEEPESPDKDLKPEPKSIFDSGLQTVQKAGGALLTGVVKGISVIPQGIMGALEEMSVNTDMYDRQFQNDKHIGFTWDNIKETAGQVGDFASQAIKAGASQSQRILQSNNLAEFSDNAMSGVELLKSMPGDTGEFYRNQSSYAGKFATGVAGLGIEILLDPVGGIAKGAFKGSVGLATKLGANIDTAETVGRGAANLLTGNVVGGVVAGGARLTAKKATEKLVTYANKATSKGDYRKAENAMKILETFVGPSSLATSPSMKIVMAQYSAYREELPKEMLKIANKTATFVSHLDDAGKTQAQKLFGELASAKDELAENAILNKLEKLNLDRATSASIGQGFREANKRLITVLENASDELPQYKDMLGALSEYHVRRSYRMFVDPKVKEDWLDHLVKLNTDSSFQLAHTKLADNILNGLNLKKAVDVPKLDIRTDTPAEFNEGSFIAGSSTREKLSAKLTPTKDNAGLIESYKEALAKTETELLTASPKRQAALEKRKATLTAKIEKWDTLRSGLPESSVGNTTVTKLREQLDLVDQELDLFDESMGKTPQLDKLLARKSALQNQLDIELQSSTIGGPANDGARFDPAMLGDPNAVKNQIGNADDAFSFIRQELQGTPDAKFIPSVTKIQVQKRQQFAKELQEMLTGSGGSKTSLDGFVKDEDGVFRAQFKDNEIGDKTLLDIQEWTADWGRKNGLSEDDIADLNAATTASIVYVPGSKEFVSMVRSRPEALKDLDPDMHRLLSNEMAIQGVDASAISPQTLDPVWHGLFGKIDNFSTQVAEQGEYVGEVAARMHMLSEMKKRGLVLTKADIEKNPELLEQGGWVQAGDVFKASKDDPTVYYVQATNQRVIKAIDRSLSEVDVMKPLSMASNLFRRAALVTDPSAHATQFLGNIAMLQMMGFRDVFGKNVDLVGGFSHAFKSAMIADDLFREAVDGGLAVSQTILSGAQKAHIARTMPALPKTGGKEQALSTIFRLAKETYEIGRPMAVEEGARRSVNAAAKTIFKGAGTDAIDIAGQVLSPSSMFQLSDQMTRLFAYRSAMIQKNNQLIKGNKWLSNFTQDGGARINWQAVEQHITEGGKPGVTIEKVKELQEQYKLLREEAAQLGNDIALNYNDVPLAVQAAAKTGVVPFIKFQWKATGRIMEFMDEKPWAFSPYYAAQRNMNQAVNSNPDDFEKQRMGLSPAIRDAFVIPTGVKDSMGRQEFIDLSRWLPFGMYASSAQNPNGTAEGGLPAQPNNLLSTPIIDLYHSLINADEEMAPNQAFSSFMAQKLAETFGGAGFAPGGRKIETLARAIQESTVYVDETGNVINREPSAMEKLVVDYAGIPEKVGYGVEKMFKGDELATSPFGVQKDPTAFRPRTTVEQAQLRYAIPGFGFSADTEKSYMELTKRFEFRLKELEQQRNNILKEIGSMPTDEQTRRLQAVDAKVAAVHARMETVASSFALGE